MQVIWKDDAIEQLNWAIDYGVRVFGERVGFRFFQNVESYNRRLMSFPYLGSLEPQLSHLHLPYRSLVIHDHYKLIYRVSEAEDTVYVVALWDTRRNPQDMNADLSAENE